ncbi:hypothetical protein M083_1237 [Bacteroides fragilis str. 3986 T(B)9]|uniref:Uncharacterized protein n=3 Tax=Bacteroides fragilis TaxID=817 RepID=A0A015XCW6_BACFG|nr:hypothetical protein M077_1276 [Bacteroides fragilis str. 2-F-2 \
MLFFYLALPNVLTLSGGKGVPDHFLLFSFQTVFYIIGICF